MHVICPVKMSWTMSPYCTTWHLMTGDISVTVKTGKWKLSLDSGHWSSHSSCRWTDVCAQLQKLDRQWQLFLFFVSVSTYPVQSPDKALLLCIGPLVCNREIVQFQWLNVTDILYLYVQTFYKLINNGLFKLRTDHISGIISLHKPPEPLAFLFDKWNAFFTFEFRYIINVKDIQWVATIENLLHKH